MTAVGPALECVNASGATAVNNAPIILYTCNGTLTGTNEIWWMDTNPFPDGVQIRNKRDNRCVDVSSASTANNAPLVNNTCNDSGPWNQLYGVRTGSFDCTARDSDWQVTTGLCVSTLPTPAVLGIWFNVPATMAYKDSSTYVLSNELRSRINADVVNRRALTAVTCKWAGGRCAPRPRPARSVTTPTGRSTARTSRSTTPCRRSTRSVARTDRTRPTEPSTRP